MQTAKEKVEQVIRDYIRGTYEGNADLLERVFHPKAQMAGFLGGQMVYGTAEPFISDIRNNPSVESSGLPYEANMTHVEVSGDTASATLEEKGLMGMNFTNYLHLLREEDVWYIVSKTFSGVSP